MDNWQNRSEGMTCGRCMWFVEKTASGPRNPDTDVPERSTMGRCRRRAPTMNGFPVVFESDWCGDHKLSENA